MTKTRKQLTLFINQNQSTEIEKIRQTFNPIQYALIKSHLTLCREDELQNIEKVLQIIRQLNQNEITIDFGEVVRFSYGNGVLIPPIDNKKAFNSLRESILQGVIDIPRLQEPHITLMHPRNATCTDAIFEDIQKRHLPNKITFTKISLIEQEIGQKWRVLEEFELNRQ